jgi:hypothetical protein
MDISQDKTKVLALKDKDPIRPKAVKSKQYNRAS